MYSDFVYSVSMMTYIRNPEIYLLYIYYCYYLLEGYIIIRHRTKLKSQMRCTYSVYSTHAIVCVGL
jgi:hypothetical protein